MYCKRVRDIQQRVKARPIEIRVLIKWMPLVKRNGVAKKNNELCYLFDVRALQIGAIYHIQYSHFNRVAQKNPEEYNISFKHFIMEFSLLIYRGHYKNQFSFSCQRIAIRIAYNCCFYYQ
ncbi:hypothetical protein M8C21_012617 [Ambrosia artemisiifolia]|uniref:Uncharacterized protein n=1 Tax=Ambrosia artemisiifolia TaxID=4212 RepID=A0AAD5BZT6_AMBAR|nr:hypothetical protein M8C21_012617 [Ambrosia artemisiifolia]